MTLNTSYNDDFQQIADEIDYTKRVPTLEAINDLKSIVSAILADNSCDEVLSVNVRITQCIAKIQCTTRKSCFIDLRPVRH